MSKHQPSSRVAIIALHGVGAPTPGRTASELACSLHGLGEIGVKYGRFVQTQHVFRLGALASLFARHQGTAHVSAPKLLRAVHAFTGLVLGLFASRARPPFANSFDSHQTATDTWKTIGLTSSRIEEHGRHQSVHLFELNWSDLRGGNRTIWSTLKKTLVLLLNLLHVGHLTLDHATAESRDRLLHVWERVHRGLVWVLSLIIPALTATYFLLLIACTPLHLPEWAHTTVGVLACGSILVWGLRLLGANPRAHLKLLALGATTLALACLAFLVPIIPAIGVLRDENPYFGPLYPSRLLAVGWLALSAISVDPLFRQYDRIRPGALAAYRCVFCVGFLLFLHYLGLGALGALPADRMSGTLPGTERDLGTIFAVSFSTSEIVGFLAMAWCVVAMLGTTSGVLALASILRSPQRGSTRILAQRRAWSVHVTLGVSALAFQTLQYVLFEMAGFDWFSTVFAVPIKAQGGPGIETIFLDMVAFLTPPVVLTVGTALLVLSAVVALGPPLLAAQDAGRPLDEQSRRIGGWVSGGMSALRSAAGALLGCAVPATAALSVAVLASSSASLESLVESLLASMTLGLGVVLAIGVTVRPLANAYAAAIGLAVDVEQYLREHPLGTSMRATVIDRLGSLLKSIIQSRQVDGLPAYDSIVIVGHSQGTVIASDALRYVAAVNAVRRWSGEVGRESPAISLVTCGSPLVEWYSRCIPDIYGQVGASSGKESPKLLFPDPHSLGVRSWTNLYRSGDYIGRTLWCQERRDIYETSRWNSGIRFERCLGPGGHLEYWGAKDLALEVDRVVSQTHLQP